MLDKALSYLLFLCGLLYQAFVPCYVPEQLPANTVDRQQVRHKILEFFVYQNAKCTDFLLIFMTYFVICDAFKLILMLI